MNQEEILRAVLEEIKLLREEIAGNNRPIMTTEEVCKFLGIKHPWILTHFHKKGFLPGRYGSQRGGYKYSKSEVQYLQTKLISGEVRMPKYIERCAA